MVQMDDGVPKKMRANMQPRPKIPPYDNPCAKEHDLSLNCLSENGYDREKCTLAFANYQACKDFWNSVRLQRRREGIWPHMPEPEEREKILKERRNKS